MVGWCAAASTVGSALDEFLRHCQVALGTSRLHVVQQDGLAEARGLREAHIPRDRGAEDLTPEEFLRLARHLFREVETRIEHREQHALDGETRIVVLLHEPHGVEQFREALERVVLALNGNQHRVGRGEHVQREQAERWRAVDQDELVRLTQRREPATHDAFARGPVHEFDFGAHQVLRRRDHVQGREPHMRVHDFRHRHFVDQHVVQRAAHVVGADPDAARRVPLRVGIDEERPVFGRCEGCRHVDGGGGLPDATFLIRHGDHVGHILNL